MGLYLYYRFHNKTTVVIFLLILSYYTNQRKTRKVFKNESPKYMKHNFQKVGKYKVYSIKTQSAKKKKEKKTSTHPPFRIWLMEMTQSANANKANSNAAV